MADSKQPVFGSAAAPAPPQARVRLVNREQLIMRTLDVERLIAEDHAARAIWEFVGGLNLSPFYQQVKAVEGRAGQPGFDPRLLISVWIYGLSRGINSARELSECCDWEPGLQWLCALEPVNYHSLSTFRAVHGETLKKLFVEVLAALKAAGMVDLERVTVDGTRIRAQGSNDSFHKGKRIEQHLEEAKKHLEALEQEASEETGTSRQQAARERARRERRQRLEEAQQRWEEVQKSEGEEKAATAQVSFTEADARIMKQPGGSFAPNYNQQLATDAKQKIIVGAVLSDSGADMGLLAEVIDEVEQTCGKRPQQVIVDGGYVSAENIEQMEQRGIETIGPAPQANKTATAPGGNSAYSKAAFQYNAAADVYQCPEGKNLVHIRERAREGGSIEHYYRAKGSDCAACAHKSECCPKAKTCGRTVTRTQPNPLLQAFREKMATEAYQQQYRKRSEVAEFPNAWLKEKLGLRRFRLRGRAKAAVEGLWAVITYNIQQWIRVIWRNRAAEAHA